MKKTGSIKDLLKDQAPPQKLSKARYHEYSTDLPPLGQVDSIQMFIPSSDYIKAMSVMEIVKPEDLESNMLGIKDMEEACGKCDNFLYDCPGHSAHIPFPVPVTMVAFVRKLIDVLNCICFYCQRIRLSPQDPKYAWIMSLPADKRMDPLSDICSKIKRCGDDGKPKSDDSNSKMETDNILDLLSLQASGKGCGELCVQFNKEDRDNAFLVATVPLEVRDHEAYNKDQAHWRPPAFGPQEIYDCLRVLDQESLTIMGFTKDTHPANMFWNNFFVPSLNARPCHTFRSIGTHKKQSYNGWSKYLRTILQCKDNLETTVLESDDDINLCVYAFQDLVSHDFRKCFRFGYLDSKKRAELTKRFKKEEKKSKTMGAKEAAWRELTKQVAAFHSYKHKKYAQKGSSFGKPQQNVEDRYRGQKAGRWRSTIIARRCDFMMRMVNDGDLDILPNQIGVPRIEAMNITRKVFVTRHNLHQVQKWVLNGPLKYPGANYVMMKDGTEKDLHTVENRRDIDLSQVSFVRRHIQDGDVVLVNRQPTLHRLSMIAVVARLHDSMAGMLHPSIFNPLAADCDGDEINLYDPQDVEAIAELTEIVAMKDCIMKGGVLWITFIQNAVNGALTLTQDDTKVTQSEASHLLMTVPGVCSFPETRHWSQEGEPLYTGKQIFSALLPDDLTIIHKHYQIVQGELISGVITSDELNGSHGILAYIYRNYPHQRAVDFLSQGYLMFQEYLDSYGHSAGYYDCAVDYHHVEQAVADEKQGREESEVSRLIKGIQHAESKALDLFAYADQFKDHVPNQGRLALEHNIRDHSQKVVQLSTDAVFKYHSYLHEHNGRQNGMLINIASGAPGSKTMLRQMSGFIGQIYVMYKRFVSLSSHYRHGYEHMQAYGFALENYSTGVSPRNVIAQAHSTCESVVRKNRGTAESGYTVRKLTTAMMGHVVDHFGRVINTDNQVIWECYGNDGYDPKLLLSVPLRMVQFPEWDILRRYGTCFVLRTIMELSSSHGRKQWTRLINNQESIVDRTWFEQLVHVDVNGHTVTDQTLDLAPVMEPATLYNWEQLKSKAQTLTQLTEDTHRLFILYHQMMQMLQKSHNKSHILTCRSPVNFRNLFDACKYEVKPSEQVNLHPLQYQQFRDRLWFRLCQDRLVVETNLAFKLLFYDWFSTRSLMLHWHFGLQQLLWLAQKVRWFCMRSRIQAGESVGTNSTQSLGEVFTQMSLKAPKVQGNMKGMMTGSAIMKNLVDGSFSNPSMRIMMSRNVKTESEASMFGFSLICTFLRDLTTSYPTYAWEHNVCRICIPFDRTLCIRRMVSLRKVAIRLSKATSLPIGLFTVPFMDSEGSWTSWITIPKKHEFWETMKAGLKVKTVPLDVLADNLVYNMMSSIVVNGIPNIMNFSVEKTEIRTVTGISQRWLVETLGSALAHVLRMPQVDATRTTSNDAEEVQQVLGMHAARKTLEAEYIKVMSGMADTRHIKVIARAMTSHLMLKGMKVSKMGKHIPPLQRAAYERGFDQLTESCFKSEQDDGKTVCGSAMTSKLMNVGTGYGIKIFQDPEQHELVPFKARTQDLLRSRQICQYAFASKVDGIRLYLDVVTTSKKVQTVTLTDRENLVFHFNTTGNLPAALFHGTVLDGDLVQLKDGSGPCFVVFDCLMSCGNQSAILRYDQRLEIARALVQRCHQGALTPVTTGWDLPGSLPTLYPQASSHLCNFGTMPFRIIVKPLMDRVALQRYDQEIVPHLPFHVDGYIATHLADPAMPFRMNRNGVFKLKIRQGDYSENTIDFRVSLDLQDQLSDLSQHFVVRQKRGYGRIPADKMSWLGNLSPQQLETFRDSDLSEVFLWTTLPNQAPFCFSRGINQLGSTIQTGDVCECRWNYRTHGWEVFRIRKKAPNQWETVVHTLQNIVEDIKLVELATL